MKHFSPQLFAFLQTRTVYNRADLFLIELNNGQIITATTAQQDIPFGFAGLSIPSPLPSPFYGPLANTIYYSTKYGAWERGSITSEASYIPKSNTMNLTVLANQSILYPGTTTPLMQVVAAGIFDAAQVTVYTVYWAIGDTPAGGIGMGYETKFVGQISKVLDSSRDKITFEVADMLYRLSTEIPKNVIQSSCRHTLFDPNCTLNQASFSFANAVAAGSTTLQINLANNVTTASYWNGVITFTQGKIQFTSGKNNGIWAYIKNMNSDTQILLNAPLPFPVNTGDQFTMYPGCNLSIAMCQLGFNNLINIGSMPFTPNPEVAL